MYNHGQETGVREADPGCDRQGVGGADLREGARQRIDRRYRGARRRQRGLVLYVLQEEGGRGPGDRLRALRRDNGIVLLQGRHRRCADGVPDGIDALHRRLRAPHVLQLDHHLRVLGPDTRHPRRYQDGPRCRFHPLPVQGARDRDGRCGPDGDIARILRDGVLLGPVGGQDRSRIGDGGVLQWSSQEHPVRSGHLRAIPLPRSIYPPPHLRFAWQATSSSCP